ILSGLNLDVRKGEILGIIGPSGSGKSTLLRLLMRFWDVNHGSVKLSNTDVKDINTANLRQMEALVTQDTHLFHDSIANNLRIAKPDATQAELEEACRKASVHDFILSLPKGYDTPVAELGDSLSGGERQRLGLADRKSTRLNSSHVSISYAVFCLKKKNTTKYSDRVR